MCVFKSSAVSCFVLNASSTSPSPLFLLLADSNAVTIWIRHDMISWKMLWSVCCHFFVKMQRDNDKDHKVRLAIGNGVRAEIWREFLSRFGNIEVREFYASTEGNVGFVNYAGKIGAIGRVNFLHRVRMRSQEHNNTYEYFQSFWRISESYSTVHWWRWSSFIDWFWCETEMRCRLVHGPWV